MINKNKRICSGEFKEQMIKVCKEYKLNKNVKNEDIGKTNLVRKDEPARLKKES